MLGSGCVVSFLDSLIVSWVVVSNIFYFHPYLGKIPILTNIFSDGLVQPPTSFTMPQKQELLLELSLPTDDVSPVECQRGPLRALQVRTPELLLEAMKVTRTMGMLGDDPCCSMYTTSISTINV